MRISEKAIPECYELCFAPYVDVRGVFIKTYCHSIFNEMGLESTFLETFHTVSGPRVLRGMHLQLPPADQAKMVFCIAGRVMDVMLDLRLGSPTYKQHVVIELEAARHNAVYLPRGVAHGFYVLEAPAVLFYQVTSEYVPQLDSGVAWNSFGAPWPDDSPLISQRDASLPILADFQSPFLYPARGMR
jgi:dTDP-4-dehydrorhamnose 3,5-epimerase